MRLQGLVGDTRSANYGGPEAAFNDPCHGWHVR
jgi:hypothetical protein